MAMVNRRNHGKPERKPLVERIRWKDITADDKIMVIIETNTLP